MYFLGWMSIIVFSLWFSLAAFIWAYRSGQFSDQERARYLALVQNYSPPPTANQAKAGFGLYFLMAIALLCLAVIMAPLILGILKP
jgi:cbb3-type cytochrome oxidase maturation protein